MDTKLSKFFISPFICCYQFFVVYAYSSVDNYRKKGRGWSHSRFSSLSIPPLEKGGEWLHSRFSSLSIPPFI